MREARTPVATYRLQLRSGFGFSAAREVLDYLKRLGVSTVYASPFLQARAGSTHGYDVTAYDRIDAEIGSEEEFRAFSDALRAHGMSLVLDFVPNHMAADPTANLWWRDVLEHGPSSRYAPYFDIEWAPPQSHLTNKVLLPILGDSYGLVLDRGELRVELTGDWPTLRYFENDLPVAPRPLGELLGRASAAVRETCGEEVGSSFDALADELASTPPYTLGAATEERLARTERGRARLGELLGASEGLRKALVDTFADLDADALHDLLEAQPYRLAFWRTASHEINYRRFFDIDALVGVRMERESVFRDAHQRVARLVREGRLDGLRLDHIDGLLDPREYLVRLREMLAENGAPDAWVVVEKILTGTEALADDWPVDGTSGYDFLNDVGRLFVDPSGERAMERVYRRFTGERHEFPEMVLACKRLIMDTSLASELNVLVTQLDRIAKSGRDTRDYTWNSLRDALEEVVASFPVYRTYVDGRGASDRDRAVIDRAVRRARRGMAATPRSIFDFIRRVLVSPRDDAERAFGARLQQYTGPVEAKGLEDTAFYRYARLLSLCEVGGDPTRFGSNPAEFHETNRVRGERWPDTMLGTSTHDTKRGEDARARLSVLSEIPLDWSRHLFHWRRLHAALRPLVDDEEAPDRHDEYVFYQTLLAVWPPDGAAAGDELVERVTGAMIKAAREAKRRTSWLAESEDYEAALRSFVRGVLAGPRTERFLADFAPFARRLAYLGAITSLAQVVLKAASPGVPDVYQGTELWDLSLVDPDNRRPVDFARRTSALDEIEPALDASAPADERARRIADLLATWPDGRVKMLVTAASLRLRHRHPEVFRRGRYEPLFADGPAREHVVAFARRHGERTVVVAAPRLVTRVAAGSDAALELDANALGDTVLPLPPSARLCCVLTGAPVSGDRPLVRDLFRAAPVALLASP